MISQQERSEGLWRRRTDRAGYKAKTDKQWVRQWNKYPEYYHDLIKALGGTRWSVISNDRKKKNG